MSASDSSANVRVSEEGDAPLDDSTGGSMRYRARKVREKDRRTFKTLVSCDSVVRNSNSPHSSVLRALGFSVCACTRGRMRLCVGSMGALCAMEVA